MRKTVLSLTFGMAAACVLAMLTAVYADDNAREMGTVDDLKLDITEDISDSDFDLSLPAPETPKTAAPKAKSAPKTKSEPVKELAIAQNPAPANAEAAPITDAVTADTISNILEEPALNAPATQPKVQIPEIPAPASVKTPAEPVIPQLPPVQQSIVKTPETEESLPPAVTIDPTMETAAPFDQPVTRPIPGSSLIARGPAPILSGGGGCPNCIRGGMGFDPTPRPVYYGVQRNGLPAYPRAGNCCGCGGRGCPGCGFGHRYPMEYPYYTLRGPRDFDDPNPRPIGP
ncbi:MAG: hypothetical protein IJQ31_13235 [Thermoguttaceae bacterium]|nr:hypothetical protein [Thermoguttaceae bacterium]